MQIKVHNYKKSKNFEINTFGVSGLIKLEEKKIKKNDPQDLNELEQQNIMDRVLDPQNQKKLEIGTYISLCPHPFSKTKMIKFLPRYILKNKLDLPIVIKEFTQRHQICILPNEEVYFNFGDEQDDRLTVRLLNIDSETKMISQINHIPSEF